MAMGGAFTAVADDANAPIYNPAGLAGIANAQAALTRTGVFSGLTDPLVSHDSIHLVVPAASGAATVGATTLADGEGIYRETTVSAGYGFPIGDRFKAGVLVKWLSVGLADVPDVTRNPYFADGTSVTAITADAGLMLEPVEGWTLGAAAQNIIPADLTFRASEDEDSDNAPQIVRLGTAYRLASIASSAEEAALQEILQRSLIAADVAVGDGTTLGIGAELGFSDTIAGRIGYRSASGRGESAAAVTLGASVGFDLGGILLNVDYAAELGNSLLQDNVSQRISLRAAF